jgi:hypothetical protein
MSQAPIDNWHIRDSFMPLRGQNLVDASNNQVQSVTEPHEIHNTGKGKALNIPPTFQFNNPAIVYAANQVNTPINRGYGAILMAPLTTPTANVFAFLDAPMLTIASGSTMPPGSVAGVAMSSVGGSSSQGAAYGPFAVAGIVSARVNIIAVGDTAVTPAAAGSALKSTGGGGAAQLVWVAGGVGTATSTGEQWAVIRLAPPIPAGIIFRVALSSPSGSVSTGYSYTVKDLNGKTLGTALTPEFRIFAPSAINLTGSATTGDGYYNTSGTFVLRTADETYKLTAC